MDADGYADKPRQIVCAGTMVFSANFIEQTIMTSQGDVKRMSFA